MDETNSSKRWRSPDEPCLNCGDATPGRYCPSCGQRKTEVLVSVRGLIMEVIEDQLVLNRTLPRTLKALLFKPGLLTTEYVRGRVVRYTAPFRLYLVSSVVFFLILSFVGIRGVQVNISGTADDAREGVITRVDSLGTSLRAQLQTLQRLDTLGMDESARAEVRAEMSEVSTALAGLEQVGMIADSADFQLDADTTIPRGGLQPWARQIDFDGSSGLFRRALERKLAQVGHLPGREAIREVLRDLLEYAPHMVFILLPLFALVLKLLYIRRDRYYAEHFIFALHVHAFVFTMFTLMIIVPWRPFDMAVLVWIALYIWLALKHVYAQGWIRTTLKWWTLGWIYFVLFLAGLLGLGLTTLLLT